MKTSTIEQPKDSFLQADEASKTLHVHPITLLRWSKRGIAPKPKKIGGRWFYRNSEIQQLIAGEWEAK